MKTIAFIPARGGSKGIERKNLSKVGTTSLVGRSIQCIKNVTSIDHIFVSTEDLEIRKEALKYGAEVPFLRKYELASDYASMIDTVDDALENYNRQLNINISTVILLEPTNPFRKSKSIQKAIDIYNTGKYASVIGVCPLERKPENIFQKKNDLLEKFIKKPDINYNRRQEMSDLCRLSGVVYVFDYFKFVRDKRFITSPLGYVENTSIEAINIDTHLDLDFACFVANKYNL